MSEAIVLIVPYRENWKILDNLLHGTEFNLVPNSEPEIDYFTVAATGHRLLELVTIVNDWWWNYR